MKLICRISFRIASSIIAVIIVIVIIGIFVFYDASAAEIDFAYFNFRNWANNIIELVHHFLKSVYITIMIIF